MVRKFFFWSKRYFCAKYRESHTYAEDCITEAMSSREEKEPTATKQTQETQLERKENHTKNIHEQPNTT